jgi:hypothetical protein
MEDAEESFGTWANLSFIAIHKACTTDVCVSLPAHHCRRPKGGARGWRKLVCGLAWASLLPSILALVWVFWSEPECRETWPKMDDHNTAELNKAGPFRSKTPPRSLAYTIHAEGGNQYRACQGRALVLCDDDARL